MSAARPRKLGIGQWLPVITGFGRLPFLPVRAGEVGWETAVPSTAGQQHWPTELQSVHGTTSECSA